MTPTEYLTNWEKFLHTRSYFMGITASGTCTMIAAPGTTHEEMFTWRLN